MHVGRLILAAILTVILNRNRLATASVGIVVHTNHLAVVLCGKQCLVFAAYVNSFMELRLAMIHWVTTVAER